jgi:hypothetical protein
MGIFLRKHRESRGQVAKLPGAFWTRQLAKGPEEASSKAPHFSLVFHQRNESSSRPPISKNDFIDCRRSRRLRDQLQLQFLCLAASRYLVRLHFSGRCGTVSMISCSCSHSDPAAKTSDVSSVGSRPWECPAQEVDEDIADRAVPSGRSGGSSTGSSCRAPRGRRVPDCERLVVDEHR